MGHIVLNLFRFLDQVCLFFILYIYIYIYIYIYYIIAYSFKYNLCMKITGWKVKTKSNKVVETGFANIVFQICTKLPFCFTYLGIRNEVKVILGTTTLGSLQLSLFNALGLKFIYEIILVRFSELLTLLMDLDKRNRWIITSLRACSLVVSDLCSETKGSQFKSGWYLCAEVNSLQ